MHRYLLSRFRDDIALGDVAYSDIISIQTEYIR